MSIDSFTVPTATFRVLFVLVMLAHDRRRIVHFNVTEHPTAEWISQQMVEAFGDGMAPRFMIRDRDAMYALTFRERVKALGRRECLDHVVVLGEAHLRRIMRSYVSYYHGARTHLALEKDAPEPRMVQPPEKGRVVEISEVGGLHHRYVRRAA